GASRFIGLCSCCFHVVIPSLGRCFFFFNDRATTQIYTTRHPLSLPDALPICELKTKPTQHSVRELMEIGIQPDLLIVRTERPISDEIKRKIALFCNVEFGAEVESPDVRTIYEIPLVFHEQGLDAKVVQKLGLEMELPNLSRWRELVQRVLTPH